MSYPAFYLALNKIEYDNNEVLEKANYVLKLKGNTNFLNVTKIAISIKLPPLIAV